MKTYNENQKNHNFLIDDLIQCFCQGCYIADFRPLTAKELVKAGKAIVLADNAIEMVVKR